MASPNPKTYEGGCHCGQNRFKATFPQPLDSEDSSVIACNCTICTKNGYLMAFVNENESLQWQKGGFDELKRYTFNKGHIMHYFCTNCGTSVAARGEGGTMANMVGLNVSGHFLSKVLGGGLRRE